jgi:hypothetical protein
MIYSIKGIEDPLATFINDDPIRPHILPKDRFGKNKYVLALTENDSVCAIVCAKLCSVIPSSEKELLTDTGNNPSNVIFYTIWSYKSGSGQRLIREGGEFFKKQNVQNQRFVTLSPPTEMARKFHTKNGAIVLRINEETVNYEYLNI